MPCSIAACSTVFPFSTVSCCPSIVRFTVSISSRSYNHLNPVVQRSSLRSNRPLFPARRPHMDAVRLRLASALEWGVAAAFLAATLAVASLILQDLRGPALRAASAPVAAAPVAAIPAAVPAGAVSVPVLPFRDGKEIRVGDTAAAVIANAGAHRRKRARGGRSGPARAAADALLRIRRLPLHPRLRAVRAERRAAGRRPSICRRRGSGGSRFQASRRSKTPTLTSRSPPARRCPC